MLLHSFNLRKVRGNNTIEFVITQAADIFLTTNYTHEDGGNLMENRKRLHDCGLALVIIGILNLFMFGATLFADFVSGGIAEQLALIEADLVGTVKAVLFVTFALVALLVAGDVLLGIKALKVSKTPNAKKGYIIVAMVSLVLSIISTISHVNGLIGGNANVVEAVLNVANSALNVCIYVLFIKAANAVRKDVLSGKK